MTIAAKLEKAKSIGDVFSLVKKVASEFLGCEEAGLLIGVTDLGLDQASYTGAFYSMDSHTIVINKRPLQMLQMQGNSVRNSYLFHVLMHEYLKSMHLAEEEDLEMLVYEVLRLSLGESHPATQIANGTSPMFPRVSFDMPRMQSDIAIEFEIGIDRQNTNYIM